MEGKNDKPLSKSEQHILNALRQSPTMQLRWGEIRKKTGLSSRTLSDRLKNLESKAYIVRHVDVKTESYPPPVYYRLVKKEEIAFAEGIQREWTKIQGKLRSLYELTKENPESYMNTVFEMFLWDFTFTLYHMAKAPTVVQAMGLLHWHTTVDGKTLFKVAGQCAQNDRFMAELEKRYKEECNYIAEKERTGKPLNIKQSEES